jgi:hypothetical protein
VRTKPSMSAASSSRVTRARPFGAASDTGAFVELRERVQRSSPYARFHVGRRVGLCSFQEGCPTQAHP